MGCWHQLTNMMGHIKNCRVCKMYSTFLKMYTPMKHD